jgi:GMP reductase
MVHIEEDVKLDFKDVLIRPKRSTLRSRSEVSVERTFTFRNSRQEWTGVPVMVANMDTTGTFEMARALSKHKMFIAMHKHYSIDEWKSFIKDSPEVLPYIAASSGTSEEDFNKLKEIIAAGGGKIAFVCLDVANGYSEHFVAYLRRVRADPVFQKSTIIAGATRVVVVAAFQRALSDG